MIEVKSVFENNCNSTKTMYCLYLYTVNETCLFKRC